MVRNYLASPNKNETRPHEIFDLVEVRNNVRTVWGSIDIDLFAHLNPCIYDRLRAGEEVSINIVEANREVD